MAIPVTFLGEKMTLAVGDKVQIKKQQKPQWEYEVLFIYDSVWVMLRHGYDTPFVAYITGLMKIAEKFEVDKRYKLISGSYEYEVIAVHSNGAVIGWQYDTYGGVKAWNAHQKNRNGYMEVR